MFHWVLLLFCALLLSGCQNQPAATLEPLDEKPLALNAYYLSEGDTCVVMMDLQPPSTIIRDLPEHQEHFAQLLTIMLKEYQQHASAHCSKASKTTLMAVIIEGHDTYGRPDFANRTNLFKLSGISQDFQMLPTDSRLRPEFYRLKDKFQLSFSDNP